MCTKTLFPEIFRINRNVRRAYGTAKSCDLERRCCTKWGQHHGMYFGPHNRTHDVLWGISLKLTWVFGDFPGIYCEISRSFTDLSHVREILKKCGNKSKIVSLSSNMNWNIWQSVFTHVLARVWPHWPVFHFFWTNMLRSLCILPIITVIKTFHNPFTQK